ncbi:hypothetical protein UPYG_G00303140 [Umbra pygmaea]|uniref:Uncharacterized protein n=1 Tax=Umbra pygmaea TaxID=75934 RepID=A0ABD0W6Q3_UMBPY
MRAAMGIRTKQQVLAMYGNVIWSSVLFLCLLPISPAHSEACRCPGSLVLAQFPSFPPTEACCLNYSGSMFGRVSWASLMGRPKLQVLDLSNSNITAIDLEEDADNSISPLREVYLGHNSLASIPQGFLSHLPSLRVLDLGMNQLRELPDDFLQGCDGLRELDLGGNRLRSLPTSVLSLRSLERLKMGGNPWDCSCSLVEALDSNNHNGSLQGIVGNITCSSPPSLEERLVWSVWPGDVCRPPGLTALFILLPLLILLGLVLCWCCGRKRKRKEPPAFGSSKKKTCHSHPANGHRPTPTQRSVPPGVGGGGGGTPRGVGSGSRECVLNNQLLLRPSSALLGSTRDVCKEMEIQLGESNPSSPRSAGSSFTEGGLTQPAPQGDGAELGQDRLAELDAVSVTEVMKDSADREKAYMTQSTKYYSLVPGIELDASDQGSDHASAHGSDHASAHGSDHASAHGSDHGSDNGLDHWSDRADYENVDLS